MGHVPLGVPQPAARSLRWSRFDVAGAPRALTRGRQIKMLEQPGMAARTCRALPIDFQHHVITRPAGRGRALARYRVEIVEDTGMLQVRPARAARIAQPGRSSTPDRALPSAAPGGVRNGEPQLRLALQQARGRYASTEGAAMTKSQPGVVGGSDQVPDSPRPHTSRGTQFQAIQILPDGVAVAFAAGDRAPARTRMKSPGVRLASRT